MKRFNFSKKFERLTSFVLALMLVLSVFTASNVAVFADTEDKNARTKETQDQVDLYVKSSTVPCIKSSTESNYQVMSAYANGYYSAKVNKAGTAVSSPDSADKAKYQLADFTMDDSKVYFVKPADWNSSDIKAHFGYSNDEANDIPMDSVSNSVFLKDSKSNTVSNLTLGNNEKLYSVTIPAGMTNVIFYYNNYEYNNYEKQTNDIINISAGNCYKLTEGTTENGTIFNAESIGSVGSLNKLNKSYSFTESTVIDFTDFSAVKTLKMSDLNLKAGDTELSENSETVLEKSNDKFSVENANGFDVKVYYNNTEITSVSDIKEYDKKVSLTVKLSDIPDMTKEYEVKVNSGLEIDGGEWQFNETDVTSIENNTFNVYAPSSEYPLSSGKEFEVTPKFEPKLKCNGESVNSGANVTYYNSNDEEIQKLEFVNSEFTNSDSKTLKYKVSYNNYTVTGEITVNCYFVSVALASSLASSSGSFVDEDNKIVYQKDESCSYDVKLDSNLTAKDINFSIDNGAKVDYSSSSNSNELTISNLTKESNLTIKYPTESGFEVKKYIVKPDNKAPEITEIKFDSENAKSDDNGLYKNGDITFTIKLKDEDSGSGIYDGSLTGNNVFSCNFDQSENVFNCTLRDKTINGDTVFTITDRVGNEKSFSFNKLIDSGKVYVATTPITNNNFEVVSTKNNGLSVATNINGINYGDDSNIIVSGAETKVESTVKLGEDLTGAGSIGNFRCAYYQDPAAEITSTPTSYVTITHNNNDFTSTDVHQSYVPMDRDTKDQELKFDYVVSTEKSGKYVLTYTVINNAGVEKTVDKTFYVDNTAPEITKVEFSKQSSAVGKILNFLTFGIYSNDTIVMNVTATDSGPTSGFDKIDDAIEVVDANGNEIFVIEVGKAASNATQESNVTYSFEPGNLENAYNLGFNVKDNAQNTLTKTLKDLIKEGNTEFNKPESLGDLNSDVLEVVSSTEKPTVKISYEAKGTYAFNASNKNIYHGDTLTVTMNLENNISGLQTMSDLSVGNFDNTNLSNFKLTKVNDEDQSTTVNTFGELVKNFENIAKKEKVTSATVMFDINISRNSEYSGKHTVELNVTDNSGNSNSKISNSTFYVDNTAPSVTNVDFVKISNPSVSDQILNFLTFGIYSNDAIIMEVTTTDLSPSSGIGDEAKTVLRCYYTDDNGNEKSTDFEEENYTIKDDTSGKSQRTSQFKIPYSKTIIYNKVELTISDNAKNVDTINLSNITIGNKTFDKDFEMVLDKDSHTSTELSYTAKGTDAFNDVDKNIYHGDTLTVTMDLENNISGLQTMSDLSVGNFDNTNLSNFKLTKVNNEDQSTTVDTFGELVENFKNIAENKKVTSATVTFDVNISRNSEYSGEHTVKLNVTDNSGNSNSEISNSTFYVDNTAPQVTNVEFVKTSNPTVTDQILNFLTFGIYSNDTIVMKVTATDSAPISGLPNDTIKVKNGETEIKAINPTYTAASNATQDSKVTYSFKLGNSAQAYILSFIVKDNAGNTSDTVKLYDLVKKGKVVADGKTLTVEQLKNVSDLFEVVSSNTDTFTFTDEFTGTDGEKYNAGEDIIRHGTEVKVTSKVEVSDLVGINNISNINCYYYADDSSGKSEVKVNADSIYDYSSETSKRTEAEINYTITTEKTGKYELSYTATNNARVAEINKKVFYVDNTAPEVTKVEFNKKDENPIGKILNFLTFGIYSNDTIVMKVTAVDKAPTSGFDKIDDAIEVADGNGIKIEKADSSNATKNGEVTYSFKLGNSAQAYILSFIVKDNAGNTSDTVKLYDLVKKGKVVADGKTLTVEQLKNVSDLFEVVSSNTDTFTFTDEFTGTDGEKYNAGEDIIRHGTEVKVTSKVEVSDLVGINNISNINCYYYADDSSGKSEVKVNADSIYDYSSETSKRTEAEINYTITTEKTGKYELSYTATNNARVAEINKKVFYVDNTAPLITKFTFESGSENVNSHVEKTDYGYYFKQDTNVKVTVVDAGTDDAVSGISEVHFYTVGVKETEHTNVQTQKESKKNVNSGDYTFKVPANFKGSVFAYAEDRAGNYYELDTTNNKDDARPVTPDKVIVENENLHKQLSNIDINLPSSNHIEGSNNLYNNDVNVTLNVSDSYSGIKSIEYSVTSDFDTDNNWNGSVSYNNSKVATTTLNGNGYASDWKIVANDSNIVTQASSTITVKNNSNNIKISVKLTDRAGNVSTKEQTLSIDKTNPTIKIEYDNNNHTTHNGTEFYKANRTATITVTERNFSPEDVISKITNTDNVIPQITGWTTHNVANGENPDGTTHTATVVYASDGDYTFDIAFTDMAGNKADKVAQHKFTVDKTIPTINVSFDNNSAKNNNYYKADRTATITVNEHNFNAQDVKVNISATGADNSTAATAPSVSSWTSNGNIHTATVKFANDGKYAFDVNYTDLADNAAKENVVTTFYVDKIAPAVKISNVENESANSGNVAPVINLSDNNYSGDYVLTLTRVDIEAKKTDVTNDFVSTVVPTSNTGAVVTYANFASDEVNDGIYVLNAALTDKAGNSSNDTITFSVNRFGSTYMGGNKETNDLLDNGYTNAEKDIVISEINVDKLTKSNISLSLDSSSLKTLKQNVDYTVNEDAKTGQWHKYNYTVKSSNFVNEGNYTIELSSTDAAKNTSTNRIRPIENRKLAVQFVVDKTAPVVNIAGIENNALYEENSKDVTVVCEDSYIDANSLVIKLDDKTLKEGKDYTVEKDVASISAKIKVNATSDITAQNVKVSVKDMAQNSGDGSVENFTLSATLLMRFFANPVLVIISAVLFAGIIALVIFIVAKKRRKN